MDKKTLEVLRMHGMLISGEAGIDELEALKNLLNNSVKPSQDLHNLVSEVVLRIPRRQVGSMHGEVPAYTASIDAALSLFEPTEIDDSLNTAMRMVGKKYHFHMMRWHGSTQDFMWEIARALCLIKIDRMILTHGSRD